MRNKLSTAVIIVLLLMAGVVYVLKISLIPQETQSELSDAGSNVGTTRDTDQTSLFKPLTPVVPATSPVKPTTPAPKTAEASDLAVKKHQVSPKKKSTGVSSSRLLQGNQNKQVATKFTKIDYHGEMLPDSALQWSCARDVDTQLLWETKLNDAGISDVEHRFSWYDPKRETQGFRDQGNCYKIECDTYAYTREINRLKLCGSDQWRLPTFTELETLLDREFFNPVINQDIFFKTRSASYWSQSQLEFNPKTAMQIDFFNGTSSPAPLHYKLAVRLVSE